MNYLCKTLIIILFFSSSAFADNNWQTQQLTLSDYFSDMTDRSMALDSSNHPHMVYGGDNLYHTYFNGTTWATELLDSSPGVGTSASIAIDNNNMAHIVYVDNYNKTVNYLVRTASGLIGEPIILGANYSNHTSIAIDGSGKRHILFNSKYITIAANDDISIAQRFDPDISISIGKSSIAVEASGKVHISYQNLSTHSLQYNSIEINGAINTPQVIDTQDAGQYNSIAVDDDGKVYISYDVFINSPGYTGYALAYATINTDGSLNSPLYIENAATFSADDISIAIDGTKKAHISYYARGEGALHYVTINSSNTVQGPFTIDSSSDDVGLYSSIALGSNNLLPHFFYFDRDSFNIKYNHNDTATFLHQGGEAGEQNAISVDNNGVSHLIYYDNGDNSLKYFKIEADGTIGGLAQVLDTVQISAIDYGKHLSIAIDKQNKKHICYRSDGQLKYISISANGLHSSPVFLGNGGKNNSLAVDTEGNAHIFYNNSSLYYLRVAADGTVDTPQVIEATTSFNGRTGDIAVDSNGNTHMIYGEGADLKHITIVPGVTFHTIQILPAGNNPQIDIDNSDKIHISYTEGYSTTRILKYMSITNGTPSSVQTINNSMNSYYHSMAADNFGKVHISYQDYASHQLKYITGQGSSWHLEIIDLSAGTGHDLISSMSVGEKQAHISYFDDNIHELKHAYKSITNNPLVPITSYLLLN